MNSGFYFFEKCYLAEEDWIIKRLQYTVGIQIQLFMNRRLECGGEELKTLQMGLTENITHIKLNNFPTREQLYPYMFICCHKKEEKKRNQ